MTTGLAKRGERGGLEDLDLLAGEHPVIAFPKVLPARIGGHSLPPDLPVSDRIVRPQMHDLIERSDIGNEEADELAEMLILKRQTNGFIAS